MLKKKGILFAALFMCFALCSCSEAPESNNVDDNTSSGKSVISKEDYDKSEALVKSLTEENTNLKSELETKSTDYDKLVEENNKLNQEMSDEKKNYDSLLDNYEALQKKYNLIELEYSVYKEKMQPYEELDEKEAEARKIEAQKKIDEEAAKKKKEEEQAAKKKEEEEKKGYNTGITYKQMARTPDDYKGKKVKFKGKVLQVMEGDKETHIRLAVNNDYDTVLYCGYYPDILPFRILQDDQLTIYGESVGLYSYQSTGAGTITIPCVWVDKIELKE